MWGAAQLSVFAFALTTLAAPASDFTLVKRTNSKRGLAYNDPTLCNIFIGDPKVSFAYNWASTSGGLKNGVMYIPLLFSDASSATGSWHQNALTGIQNGATHLFSFNEPDNSGQANMTPRQAVTAWKNYMEPLAGKAKLCAPAVTNSVQAGQGLEWLQKFLHLCTGCTIDCVNIHWYGGATDDAGFKQQVQSAASIGNGKPVWVTEIGASGSDQQIEQFLKSVMPWMDSHNKVDGYAYFWVAQGYLVDGNKPSDYGKVYGNYK